MEEQRRINIKAICSSICSGGTPKSTCEEYYNGEIPWLNTKEIDFNRIYHTEKMITEIGLENSSAKWIKANSVIVAMYGATAGKAAIAKIPLTTNQACCNLTVDESKADYRYVYYALCNDYQRLASLANGGAQQNLNAQRIKDFDIPYPSLEVQRQIADILSTIDDKIELNRRINDNLEQQAQTLFKEMFPNYQSGNYSIEDYIIPERGRGLLTKDAQKGCIPVVAGGIEPATYHNTANTTPPVISISASGANAGFVNLWHQPIWSSDSSFIDYKMTPNVYFWYILLKLRQKEIFDAQVGSAQPHIYPKHIAEMPMGYCEQKDINLYCQRVTPLFEMMGKHTSENKSLSSIRDSLLPKLMSGELKINDLN